MRAVPAGRATRCGCHFRTDTSPCQIAMGEGAGGEGGPGEPGQQKQTPPASQRKPTRALPGQEPTSTSCAMSKVATGLNAPFGFSDTKAALPGHAAALGWPRTLTNDDPSRNTATA